MNIAKLNTVSLDDKTFIIKRGTSGGGSTPINNQDKVVDITENGTVDIVPDAGYTGLSKVTINTEVSGGSSFEYLDITNVTGLGGNLKLLLLNMAYMTKVPQTYTVGGITLTQSIAPSGSHMTTVGAFQPGTEEFATVLNGITAMSINFSDTINMQGQVVTIQEVFAMYDIQAEIDAIPRITKEQFYSLD